MEGVAGGGGAAAGLGAGQGSTGRALRSRRAARVRGRQPPGATTRRGRGLGMNKRWFHYGEQVPIRRGAQPATLGALGGLSAHGPSAWGHSGPWLGFSSCESQAGGCKTGHRQRRSTGPRCDSEIRARTPSARAVVKASAEVKALSTTRQWYCCCDFSLPCAHRDSVVPVTAELRKRGKKGAMCR